MESLRNWLQDVEHRLSLPIVLKSSSKKDYESLITEQEVLQNEIEEHSGQVSDVLNVCEILINDCEQCQISLDNDISMEMSNIEKRWRNVCVQSSERKDSIQNLWSKIQNIFTIVTERQLWMKDMEKEVAKLESHLVPPLCSIENISQTNQSLKTIEKDIKMLNGERLKLIDETYMILSKNYSLPDDIVELPERLLATEDGLVKRLRDTLMTSSAMAASYEAFLKAREKALTAMVKCHATLTMVELGENREYDSPEALASYLEEIEISLDEEKPNLDEADRSGYEVIEWCSEKDKEKVQIMIDEYRHLWNEIKSRLAIMRDSHILPKKMTDQSVEANTLKFETDESVQVDTLGWNESPLSRKDAFITNLEMSIDDMETYLVQLSKLDDLDTYQKIGKCISQCDSTLDYIRHLSDLLLEQYDANETEAKVQKIEEISLRFTSLRQKSQHKLSELKEKSAHGKLSCPLCSNNNWKQLDNDLWRLEQWIRCAEGRLASQPSSPPSSMEQLEDVIQDQRELLLDLDSHRNLVLSMNIVGTHLAEHSESEERAKELRDRLASDNSRWDRICESAAAWQAKLQTALIQNGEFHDTIDELTAWLERTEVNINQSEPINLNDPANLIQIKLEKFKGLKQDLERCEPRIIGLEETAKQVMSEDTQNACQRLSRLRLRLQSLTRLTELYLARLSSVQLPASLQNSDSPIETDGDEVDTRTLVRCHHFMGRVMRASVPISAFLLLLLGAASLIPQSQMDFACPENVFFFNLAPIVRYPNGHPPV